MTRLKDIFFAIYVFFLRWIVKIGLTLRYRIEVRGEESLLDAKRHKGILFLPNHPALIDPVILMAWFWPKYQFRPLVMDYWVRNGILGPFLKRIRAIPIPDLDTSANQEKMKKVNDAIHQIKDGIANGENFLIYPTGRVKNRSKEMIEGASGIHQLVQKFPDIDVVLIRTTGLWGSSFSKAFTGFRPDLSKAIMNGFVTLPRNLIFFSPRREIIIELEMNPDEFPRNSSKVELNQYLQSWYNRYPSKDGARLEKEPLQLISYRFWSKHIDKEALSHLEKSSVHFPVNEETRKKIYQEIRRILGDPKLVISPEQLLATDLGMDSLGMANLSVFLSRNYPRSEIELQTLRTVSDVLAAAEGDPSFSPFTEEIPSLSWPLERSRLFPEPPVGLTIPEAFLSACKRMKSHVVCSDDVNGILTYKQFKRIVLVLAQYFRTLPDTRFGVLLPASSGAMIVFLALQFAGKIPVMLNWTIGPRCLEEMVRISGINVVFSSWKFLDKVAQIDLGSIAKHIQLVEDLKEQITLKEKVFGAVLALCSNQFIFRSFSLQRQNPENAAVILFTSGSEYLPKSVPLSHRNLLASIASVFQSVRINDSQSVILSFLPPFHVLGLTFAGLYPILYGYKVTFYPNPTDGFALAERVKKWRVSIVISAPSFIRNLFKSAKNNQLSSISLFISGAEKATAIPAGHFSRVSKIFLS